jgi:hypothetical protein
MNRMNFVCQERNTTPCYNPIYSILARNLSEQSYAWKSLKMVAKNIPTEEAAEKQKPKAENV